MQNAPISPSLRNLIANPAPIKPMQSAQAVQTTQTTQTNMMVQQPPQGVQEQPAGEPKKNKMGVGIAAALGIATLVTAGILMFKGRGDKAIDIASDVQKVEGEMKGAFEKAQKMINDAISAFGENKDDIIRKNGDDIIYEARMDNGKISIMDYVEKIFVRSDAEGRPLILAEGVETLGDGTKLAQKEFNWYEGVQNEYCEDLREFPNGDDLAGKIIKWHGDDDIANKYILDHSYIDGVRKATKEFSFDGEKWLEDAIEEASDS